MMRITHRLRRAGATPALAVALALVLAPGLSRATTDEEATALCASALTGTHEAQSVESLHVRRHHGRPYVYGTAEFADAGAVHFRCEVYQEKVAGIGFLIRDTSTASGTDWSMDRPRDTAHEGLELDETVMADAPLPPAVAKVVKAPEGGGQSAAGATGAGSSVRRIQVPAPDAQNRLNAGGSDDTGGPKTIKVE